jgi:predicted O-methyltransferase YrrM
MPDAAAETIRTELRRMFTPEDAVLVDARRRSADLDPPDPEEGGLLTWLAARLAAPGVPAEVVEVGAAGGVTALRLLIGLPPDGTVTSIEAAPDAHARAAEAVEVAGAGERVRSILGEAADVLPRLADGRYGLCLLQVPPARLPTLLDDALRLLAPGGTLVVRRVLRRSEHGTAVARFLDRVAGEPALTATVIPDHEGVLLATRR